MVSITLFIFFRGIGQATSLVRIMYNVPTLNSKFQFERWKRNEDSPLVVETYVVLLY